SVAPPIERIVRERGSALAINPRFVRRLSISAAGRVEEAASCAFLWIVLILWWTGHVSGRLVVCWAAAVSVASVLNVLRTLTAHRYDSEGRELAMTEQLVDSYTIDGGKPIGIFVFGHMLVAPLGLRFHALHHCIPSMPYHNLGRAHRRLLSALAGDAPYRT